MDSTFRQLAAVWFADIVGYTRLSRHDETAALGLVKLFQEVARSTTERHNGTLVKFMGDGLLAYTYSASSAIEAVLALRDDPRLASSRKSSTEAGKSRVRQWPESSCESRILSLGSGGKPRDHGGTFRWLRLTSLHE